VGELLTRPVRVSGEVQRGSDVVLGGVVVVGELPTRPVPVSGEVQVLPADRRLTGNRCPFGVTGCTAVRLG
jgi:hypothetical protein